MLLSTSPSFLTPPLQLMVTLNTILSQPPYNYNFILYPKKPTLRVWVHLQAVKMQETQERNWARFIFLFKCFLVQTQEIIIKNYHKQNFNTIQACGKWNNTEHQQPRKRAWAFKPLSLPRCRFNIRSCNVRRWKYSECPRHFQSPMYVCWAAS